MPLTVITLTNVTRALRGDLTKWMQEIATGVYIGNFNSRIREELWDRVKESIGNGEATLTYKSQTELGYSFETINTNREIIDFDGLEMVFLPKTQDEEEIKKGYSKQAEFRKARYFTSAGGKVKSKFIILDIETDGLNPRRNEILEIAAIKVKGEKLEKFQSLIHYEKNLPEGIKKLTGLNEDLLKKEGKDLKETLVKLMEFIGDHKLVGYNIDFDIRFLNDKLRKFKLPRIGNKTIDLMQLVKKDNMDLDNYKLETVLKSYEIDGKVEHRGLKDCKLIYELSTKVNVFQELIKSK